MNDDNELRKSTAEKWQIAYHAPDLSYEMINCTGCREEGVKFGHCLVCEIRNCVDNRGLVTCGDCHDIETCNIIAGIHKYVPDAKANLLSLRI
jgi:hypothetical protein